MSQALEDLYMTGWDRGRDVGRLLGRAEAFGQAAGELQRAAQLAVDEGRSDESERLITIGEALIYLSSQAVNQVPNDERWRP